jgi:predicted Zn-dependent protease
MNLQGKRFRLILRTILALTALGSGAWWWRAAQTRAAVVMSLPAQPSLDGFAPELADRIDAAERRARRLWSARAGLSELARLYHANGFLQEASACENRLIELDQTNPLWPYLLAHTIGGYGDLDSALPLLYRATQLAPGYLPARIRLGDALLKRNQSTEAAAIYHDVLSNDPNHGYAIIGLARTEFAAGQPEAALHRLQLLVQAQPQFAPGQTLLLSVEEQLGKTAEAAMPRSEAGSAKRTHEMPDPWIEDLMNDCYDPYRLAVAAAAADPADNEARARQWLERSIKIAPNYDLSFRLLGNLLSDLGEREAARRYLERAAAINPKEPDNWTYLLRLLKAMGDMPAANLALDTGLAHCPESSLLQLEKGRRFAAGKQFEAAAGAFRVSQRLRPEDPTASMELARVLFRQDRLEDGVEELRNVVKLDPYHPIAVVLLARYAISNGEHAAAEEWIRRARRQPLVRSDELKLVVDEYRSRFGRAP